MSAVVPCWARPPVLVAALILLGFGLGRRVVLRQTVLPAGEGLAGRWGLGLKGPAP